MNPGDSSDRRLLMRMKLGNLLSFGPNAAALELHNLNILIGPNAAGKSNLIEAVSLVRATPVSGTASMDLSGVVRRGGGVGEWVWKGDRHTPASVDVVVRHPQGKQSLRHVFSFRGDEPRFQLEDERIENEAPSEGRSEPYFYYQFQKGHPKVNTRGSPTERYLVRQTVNTELSILAQRRVMRRFPELVNL